MHCKQPRSSTLASSALIALTVSNVVLPELPHGGSRRTHYVKVVTNAYRLAGIAAFEHTDDNATHYSVNSIERDGTPTTDIQLYLCHVDHNPSLWCSNCYKATLRMPYIVREGNYRIPLLKDDGTGCLTDDNVFVDFNFRMMRMIRPLFFLISLRQIEQLLYSICGYHNPIYIDDIAQELRRCHEQVFLPEDAIESYVPRREARCRLAMVLRLEDKLLQNKTKAKQGSFLHLNQKRHALVIAVHSIPSPDACYYARNHALLLHVYKGYSITMLTSDSPFTCKLPTKENIDSAMQGLLSRKDPFTEIQFYYVGISRYITSPTLYCHSSVALKDLETSRNSHKYVSKKSACQSEANRWNWQDTESTCSSSAHSFNGNGDLSGILEETEYSSILSDTVNSSKDEGSLSDTSSIRSREMLDTLDGNHSNMDKTMKPRNMRNMRQSEEDSDDFAPENYLQMNLGVPMEVQDVMFKDAPPDRGYFVHGSRNVDYMSAKFIFDRYIVKFHRNCKVTLFLDFCGSGDFVPTISKLTNQYSQSVQCKATIIQSACNQLMGGEPILTNMYIEHCVKSNSDMTLEDIHNAMGCYVASFSNHDLTAFDYMQAVAHTIKSEGKKKMQCVFFKAKRYKSNKFQDIFGSIKLPDVDTSKYKGMVNLSDVKWDA